ncbi:hypothetical protein [Actinoallomurus iriomotensis]|uniref:Uncharacterized protein n=1 Tax=Actinoallomurus iriomotensis TaxID=478107 RepID=A0A9W6RUM9_9ACTN|nr:hypothetical protein [Actinoallomurus iriomotensis]GLY81869.1 hypothetical protein Airi01_101360 [Actinoallomurus iriomotensis]
MTTKNDSTASPPAKVVNLDDIAGLVDADRTFTAEIDRLTEAHKARVAEIEEARDGIREQIQRRMADATEGHIAGRPVIRWAKKKPGSHLDQKALKRDHPEIVAKYTVPSSAARPYVLLDLEDGDRG